MSVMLEVLCRSPRDAEREARLAGAVRPAGGELTYCEDADRVGGPVTLTFEFADRGRAEQAAALLREHGEHVEGLGDYGD